MALPNEPWVADLDGPAERMLTYLDGRLEDIETAIAEGTSPASVAALTEFYAKFMTAMGAAPDDDAQAALLNKLSAAIDA